MLILLTNDDGFGARGLEALRVGLSGLAEVVVIAPDRPRNAMGRSISLDRAVRLRDRGGGCFAVDGTPVDCVYMALHHILRDRPPDIVLSGINHGANLARDVTYSGTVGAAMEAADCGFPAAAISLVKSKDTELDFGPGAAFVHRVLIPLLCSGDVPAGVLLNVNIPATCSIPDGSEELPWRFTRLGRHHYEPRIRSAAHPRGQDHFWLGGVLREVEPIQDSDCMAVRQGLVSVTPLSLDLTETGCLEALRRGGLGRNARQPEPVGELEE